MTELTKVGSSVWVLPSDVVRVYYTEPTMVLDKPCEGHVYVVLRSPNARASFGFGNGDQYQTSDWPLEKVERALGLRKWSHWNLVKGAVGQVVDAFDRLWWKAVAR